MDYSKILLILIATAVAWGGQDTPRSSSSLTTLSFCNGRCWNAMAAENKILWLGGYKDGVAMCSLTVDAKLDKSLRDTESLFPKGLSWGEISRSLDLIYATPENRPIPVGNALQIFGLQSTGVEQPKIDKALEDFRRASAKNAQ
jgi:hypothetical protein